VTARAAETKEGQVPVQGLGWSRDAACRQFGWNLIAILAMVDLGAGASELANRVRRRHARGIEPSASNESPLPVTAGSERNLPSVFWNAESSIRDFAEVFAIS